MDDKIKVITSKSFYKWIVFHAVFCAVLRPLFLFCFYDYILEILLKYLSYILSSKFYIFILN